MTTTLIAAFLVGLLGAPHCLGMCGGIVAMLGFGVPRGRGAWAQVPAHLMYNLGRVLGYGLIGALFGGLGQFALEHLALPDARRALYAIAAAFMLALGLYLGGWWQGLTWLERLGARLWRHLEPIGRRLLPIRHWWQALGVGLVWAWLPCGLVYSVLIWSLAAGGAVQGGALMLAFGLGTLPNLLGLGLLAGAAARLIEQRWVRRLAGLTVFGFGVHALWRVLAG